MKKLYLVDVSAMFFRAYYAIRPLHTESGLPTNALYGFLSMTIKLLKQEKPDYMVFCFDRKEPSFRLDMYPEYKANRSEMPEDLVPQIPYIRKLTDLLGICAVDRKGYEADDVIGSFAKFGEKEKLDVIIVSGDKDFAQLISPTIKMFDPMKAITYDPQGVIEKWGIRPDQMIDYLSIVGDSSDNIPGVKGIGPKGAQKLLAEYETLENIYENIDNIKAKGTHNKLIESKENAFLSKELVKIVTDLDFGLTVEDLKLKTIDKEKLNETLTELEFGSFAKKLTGEGEASKSSNVKSQFTKEKVAATSHQVKRKKIEVNFDLKPLKVSEVDLEKLNKTIKPYSEIWMTKNERGICIGQDDKAYMVDASSEDIGKVLDGKKLQWKGFDVKSLWRELKLNDPGDVAWDDMLAAYVLKPGNISDFGKVYSEYVSNSLPELASPDQVLQSQLELEPHLRQSLEQLNGYSVFENIELPLVPVLYHMEKEGIGLDNDLLAKQSRDLEVDIKALEEGIHKEAGEAFNIASPKQLGQILFEKMGIPPAKKTKTGYSTNSDVLSKLMGEYPICGHVLEYRELAKLKSTYVDAFPELINPDTGRIHSHFKQAVAATGRLSSTHPNLQNIPIRTERGRRVRKAFVARPDHSLLSVDYSQIELRVLAEITGDSSLQTAFAEGLDIHAATASEIFQVAHEQVTPDQRRMAKAVNFGIAYGQGVFGLSETLNISRGEASEIIESYFNKFKKVRDYMMDTIALAKEQGYVETLTGRRRYIEELSSSNGNIRKFGERAAINAPIQGTASDIVKLAMIKLYEEVSVPMLLQVHDELLFSCPNDELEEQSLEIRKLMEESSLVKVPLLVNIAWGSNWEDAHA